MGRHCARCAAMQRARHLAWNVYLSQIGDAELPMGEHKVSQDGESRVRRPYLLMSLDL